MEFSKRGFCVFLSNVVCSYQKYDKPVVLDRCFSCSHYKRFMVEMDEEDEKVMAEIDMIHKYGYEFFDRFVREKE